MSAVLNIPWIPSGVVILEAIQFQHVELPQRWKHTVIQHTAVAIGVKLTMNCILGSHNKAVKSSSNNNCTFAEINCGNNFGRMRSTGRRQTFILSSERQRVNFDSSLQGIRLNWSTVHHRRSLHHLHRAPRLLIQVFLRKNDYENQANELIHGWYSSKHFTIMPAETLAIYLTLDGFVSSEIL